MTGITPIETLYRGYCFRSRLEARWAVAFDHLKIKWSYERQGYVVGENERPYLPDFWLPNMGVWVEVKGDPGELDPTLMMDAVDPLKGLPGSDPWGRKGILILGEIPDPAMPYGYLHWMVSTTSRSYGCESYCQCAHPHFGHVTFKYHSPEVIALAIEKVKRDDPRADVDSLAATVDGTQLIDIGRPEMKYRPSASEDFVTPRGCSYLLADAGAHRAFRAARSARFEHGEKPDAA